MPRRGTTDSLIQITTSSLLKIPRITPVKIAGASTAKIWCPTRELNSENPVSKTGAYAHSASGAKIDFRTTKTKKPGDLTVHPGFAAGV